MIRDIPDLQSTIPDLRPATFLLLLLIASLGSVRADSVFNFTRAVLVQNQFSGYAIANPTDVDAEVTLTAYRDDGSRFTGSGIENPRILNIPPRQQRALLLTELLGGSDPTGGSQPISLWVQAVSPTNGLAGFFLLGDGSLQTLDGSDASGADTDLLLLLINDSADTATELHLVNPGADSASINVEFYRADGSPAGASSLKLSSRAAIHRRLGELFPAQPADAAYLRIKSDVAVAAEQFSQDLRSASLVALNAQRTVARSRILNFPQLVSGGDWSSEIAVVNVSDKAIIATFRAFGENGSLLAAPALTQNAVPRLIQPAALLRTSAEDLFGFTRDQTQAGWLQVEGSDAGLTGYIAYGTGSSRAIVAAQHVALSTAIFSHQAEAQGFYTGLAILNPGTLTANVQIYSLNPNGSLRGKTKKALKPNQRESKLLRQWVSAADGASSGYILLRSDVPVIATELFGTNSGSALANVPPQPVLSDFDPAPDPNLQVFPPLAVLQTRSTQQFQARGLSGVTWSVEAPPAGGSTAGQLSASGLFTAPATPPASHTVTVVATAAGGSQSAGASVDIVQKSTLVSGLAVVRAVAYLAASKRLFLAEQQALQGKQATANPTRISELKGSATQTLVTLNDTIEKILPFTTRGGKEVLLLAGFDTGVIYLLDPGAPQAPAPVVTGLLEPASMAFTDAGDLAVAEQGANQIRIIPRTQFDAAKTGPVHKLQEVLSTAAPAWPSADLLSIFQPPSVVNSPRGVAVDTCTGEIFYTTGSGQLSGVLQGRTRLLAHGLLNPSEILAVRRGGVRCPNGLVLFVVESPSGPAGLGQIRMIVPDLGQNLVLASNLSSPSDILFLLANNPFTAGAGEGSIVVSDSSLRAGLGSLLQILVGELYTSQNEPIIPPANRQKVTLAISGSGTTTFGEPGGSPATFSVNLNLTLTGMILADGSLTAEAGARITGTASGSQGVGGQTFETGTVTFNGEAAAAVPLRESGIAGAFIATASQSSVAQKSLGILLTGNDLKTVDYVFFFGGASSTLPALGIFLRQGSLFLNPSNDPTLSSLTSTSNFRVTFR